FESFGLRIFLINDLDAAFRFYPSEQAVKINTSQLVSQFLISHPDVVTKIESDYVNGAFTLKEGDLEIYLSLHNKGLAHVIEFCHNGLKPFLANGSNSKVCELKTIMAKIVEEPEASIW
ncbi:MAG: hypothetical protein COU66_00330, partial [Candidatus Pacebacteria bacterium CG10_big_fil_rev_8_21_14_0_10_44_11]